MCKIKQVTRRDKKKSSDSFSLVKACGRVRGEYRVT